MLKAFPQETVLKAKPNSLLDKVVHQLSSSNSKDGSSSTASAAAAAISKYANVFTSTSSNYAARMASPAMGASAKTVTSATMQTKTALPSHLGVTSQSGVVSPIPRSGSMTPVNGRPGLSRANSVRDDLGNKGLEDKVWATDGVLTLDMAERMLRWHAEAVGRVVELSPSSDV